MTTSPLRRLAVTLTMTGAAAIGAVALAPAALADEPVVPTVSSDVVYDKDGNAVKAPRMCTPEDIAHMAERLAQATLRADGLRENAARKSNPNAAQALERNAARMLARAGERNCDLPPTEGGGTGRL